MAKNDPPVRLMTLANVRQNGVRGLFVTRSAWGYHAEVKVDAWPDSIPVAFVRPAYALWRVRQARRHCETERG
jgi:hypothetical protein